MYNTHIYTSFNIRTNSKRQQLWLKSHQRLRHQHQQHWQQQRQSRTVTKLGWSLWLCWDFGCLVVWSFGRLLCSVCCFRLFGTSFDFRSKLFLQYCFLLTAALLTTIPVGFVVVVVVVVLTQASFYNKETGIPTTWYSALGTYTVPPPSAASKLDSRQCGQFDVHLVWLSTAVTPAASHLPHPRRGFLGGDGSRAVYQSLTGTTHTHP